MKTSVVLTFLFTCTALARSACPQSGCLLRRAAVEDRREWVAVEERSLDVLGSRIEKRRGGGGGGGRGGFSSSGGRASSSSSSSSSSGSGGSSSSSGSRGTGSSGWGDISIALGELAIATMALTRHVVRSRSNANAGGVTRSGSGAPRSFGGGKYYGGGAAVPFKSGSRSPGGISPFILPAAALGFFAGAWLHSVFTYPYSHPYYWRNGTDPPPQLDDNTRKQTTENDTVQVLPVICLCQQYSVCGCDDESQNEFLSDILPNGTAEPAKDNSLIRIADVNGTRSVVINGTLANGTTAPDGSDGQSSGALRLGRVVMESAGWWVVVSIVGWTVWTV